MRDEPKRIHSSIPIAFDEDPHEYVPEGDEESDDGGSDSGTSSESNESESNNLDPEDEAGMEASEVRAGLAEDELDPAEIERQQMEDEKRVAAKRKREKERMLRLEDQKRFPKGTF
ncbi:hypothetical protein FALBO_6931 [Fusarium albosuccineum]|uniref:Uncharacterized protein n=1 Tax=Fusarium albosuccineum TaxID=1237068 RepID=A0A8H4PJX3_9HYPO|nr:hypothetical protein FALBO_6931 [Fusarium albosuccineum]